MAEADLPPQPVAGALPCLDEARARFANALHALIAAAPALELQRGCHARPPGALALADPAGLLWQVPQAADGSDLDSQIALLAAYEPLLLAVEEAVGLPFRPARSVSEWPEDTLWIAVRRDALAGLFGFAPPLQSTAALGARQLALTPALPMAVRLSFRAASLPLDAVETLEAGDLLCLPAGPLAVELAGAGLAPLGTEWRWRPADGSLFQAGRNEQTEGRAMDSSEVAGSVPTLTVPVTVRLPAAAVDPGELAALAEGGTIRLMPLAEGLEVELLVAGRPIATGELVRLGDDFAVLVDQVAGRARIMDPAAPPVAGA